MSDCTHGPPTPCAECLIDDLDPFKYGPISRSAVLGLMHAHAADAVAAARKKWEFGVDEDDAIEQAQWEEKVQAARREAFEEAAKLARQCLLLDREPYTPTDGQQTGDMIVVGMRDWYRHKRLARMIARDAEEGSDDG